MQEALPGLAGPVEDETSESDVAGRLHVVAHGAPAHDALVELVTELRADDPLAPVTVAVPSPLAGLALRRLVGTRTGLVNVHFIALARVAELLGAPTLAADGRRPLTTALRLEAIHTALVGDDGPLAPVSGHPATAAALATTFAELDDVDTAARTELAGRSDRAAAVIRLYDAFRELTADCYDVGDVVHAAAAAVIADAPTAAEVGHVLLFLPTALTRAEEELVAALARRDRLTVVLGLCGDDAADRGLTGTLSARLAPMLGAGADVEPLPGTPLAQRVVSAPDPDDEVRAVVRELEARARRGDSLGRVAILYRIAEPYARLLPEVLDAAGVAWTGAAPRRVADAAAGRVLLGLLALAESDLPRDDLAAWLASGPIVDPADGRHVNATRWDVLSREAGVVGGADQWAERLGRRAEAKDAERRDLLDDAEASEWQLRRVARDHAETVALAAFVADLTEALAPPDPPTWETLAQWARELLDTYCGNESRRRDWPDRELDAARRIGDVLDALAGLDAVANDAEPVDLPRFRRTIAAELDTRLERIGRFGSGVLIGALGQAYAADFDAVYVLGAVEGALPPRGREDPLLPDRERRGISGLAQHATRRLEERRDYLAALASAPERILTFPRADPRAQRKRLPARWVLESATALAGVDLTAEALRDELSPDTWFDEIESFEGLVAAGDSGSDTEYALRALRSWHDAGRTLAEHPLADGALARGFALADERGARQATEYDGFVGAGLDLAPGATRPTSPTALQTWAECPFRYFLGRVLRLHDVPRPEAIDVISPIDEGSLVHEVLEEFVRDAPRPATPSTPWTAADHTLLEEIVARRCDDAERRGITGRSVMWTLARRRVVATARRFVLVDQQLRATHDVLPAPDGLERPFGTDGAPPVVVTLDDGTPVHFRGRIDRVDRSPDGTRAVVYDYKTGSPRRYATDTDDPVHEGLLLQLPVYAMAAREQEGTDDAVAAYWFTRAETADDALLPVSLAESEDRFVEVVGSIVGGIGDGCFPAYPGDRSWDPFAMREAWDTCRFCDFDRLCTVDRGAAWERVEDDPATDPFHALTFEDEPPDDEPADDEAS